MPGYIWLSTRLRAGVSAAQRSFTLLAGVPISAPKLASGKARPWLGPACWSWHQVTPHARIIYGEDWPKPEGEGSWLTCDSVSNRTQRFSHDSGTTAFWGDAVPILPPEKWESRELGKLLMVEMVIQIRDIYGLKMKPSSDPCSYSRCSSPSGKAQESVQKEIRAGLPGGLC